MSNEIVLDTEKSVSWFDYPSMDILKGMSYDQLKNLKLEQIKHTGNSGPLYKIEFKFEGMDYSDIFNWDNF